ncbi:hypothetical protein KL908_004822 [Ogataea polymorpha]|nr:hypothetical protein KL908_004822 [Ogataea polymorpha]
MVSFHDLNEDIICFHIVPFLDEPDIRALFLTCKSLSLCLNQAVVWHQMFRKAFKNDNVPFDIYYKWPKLYKLRKSCKLLTFGNNGYSRLGWLFGSQDAAMEILDHGQSKRLVKPVELTFEDEYIADVTAGGFAFCVLTTRGNVYFTGRNWHGMAGLSEPGPKTRDYNFGSESRPAYEPGKCVNKVQLPENTKISQIGSGRSHFIGLDTNGRLWTWDSVGRLCRGVELDLHLENGDRVTGRIERIRAGWSFSSCHIDNLGIAVWNRRDSLAPHSGEYGPVRAYVSVIDGTVAIDDYIVLDNFLIYLTEQGELYRVDLPRELSPRIGRGSKLAKFQEYAEKHSAYGSHKTRFVRLSGSFNRFSAITNDDQVLLGDKSSEKPQIYRELQFNGVISVAVGDYHFLALNRKGELYAWGRESHKNGCLGLGTLSAALAMPGVRQDGNDIVVEQPVRVPVNGQVLAIAAGGWQSAALVHEK